MPKTTGVPYKYLHSLAHTYHRMLPPSARCHVDPADMVSTALCQIIEVQQRYDRRRAGYVTFCGAIAKHCFLKMVTHYQAQKREAAHLPIDEIRAELLGEDPHVDLCATAEARLEHFFSLASYEVLRFFQLYYFTGRRRFKNTRNREYQKIENEIAWLVSRTGVSAEDFRYARNASLRLVV